MNRRQFPSGLMLFLLTTLGAFSLFAQSPEASGTLEGRLVDAATQAPLMGANVVLVNTQLGAATDEAGRYWIPDVPVGSYAVQFSYLGYQPRVKTDVIVRSGRHTVVDAALQLSPLEAAAVEVRGGYFADQSDQPGSAIGFSAEEIRRAPGSAGDVSRILMSLPSVAKVNDQTNNLIVRGGSPVENAFYIDNIEIPNINHFPTQGASGGPLSLVNVDLIKEVQFYSGGFSAAYGDRLSSIMALTFREGNRREYDGQLDLNFAGFGGVAEGPLSARGSWVLSVRRSYLDLLVNTLDVGTSVAPRYGDYQWKVVYDLHPRHQLQFLGVWGDDHNRPGQEEAVENDMIYYGNQDIYERTSGLNWRALWGERGYSNTSLSVTATKFKEDFYETGSGLLLVRNRSREQALKFRNANHLRFNSRHSLEFGLEARRISADYDNFYEAYTDALGEPVAPLRLDNRLVATKLGVFLNYVATPISRLSATLGLRGDHFSHTGHFTLAPRAALSYRLGVRTSLNAAAGIYYQSLPLLLLAQNSRHRHLRDPRAVHYLLGLEHLLTQNTRLTLEVYQKDYRRFPLDPAQPGLFLIDELFYRYGFFFPHEKLIDGGQAYSRGVELVIQKKLAEKVYGLASAAYFRTRYRGAEGVWRDRVFDNRFLCSLEGGYKPNSRWEFSLRWIYAGGAPYTPFDQAASETLNRAVLDENRINAARYPDYHSLNLRFDRRFHFQRTNLVFYLSVWNAYDRQNVATYYWNQAENRPDVITQWRILPIFGLEYEF